MTAPAPPPASPPPSREARPAESRLEKKRSRGICVLWTAGLVFLLALGAFCWAVAAPVMEARGVLGAVVMPQDRLDTRGPGQIHPHEAVQRMGGPREAAGKLALYLRMPDWIARDKHTAREVLFECRAAAMPVFVELLHDPDAQVRSWAAYSLESLGTDAGPALPALTRALADQHRDVRSWAARAVGAVGPDAEAAVPALIEALRSERDLGTQGNLAEALGRIGPASAPATPELTALLGSASWATRRDAADALGRIGPLAKSAVPKLTELLSDGEYSVRLSAAEALGLIGVRTEAAVKELTRLFDDQVNHVRGNAIRAVWRLTRQPELVMPAILLNLKKNDSFFGAEIVQLLETLMEIGPAGKEADPLLVRDLTREVSFQRNDSFLALWSVRGRPGDGVLPLLETIRDPGERADAAGALGWLGQGARNAVPALRALLRDEDQDQRMHRAAARALEEIQAAREARD